jgi:hypothetical protein
MKRILLWLKASVQHLWIKICDFFPWLEDKLLSYAVGAIVLLLLYGLSSGVRHWGKPYDPKMSDRAVQPERQDTFVAPPPSNGYIGSSILKDYAAPNRPIADDLTDLSHVLKNFALLVKGVSPIPLGANEEIALALLGKNRAKLAFLPKDSQALNAQGQLIDRWGTPLWFHASTREHIDIRSAGPDKKLWTDDDVHRRYDGYLLKPEELNPRSLNDAMNAKAKR